MPGSRQIIRRALVCVAPLLLAACGQLPAGVAEARRFIAEMDARPTQKMDALPTIAAAKLDESRLALGRDPFAPVPRGNSRMPAGVAAGQPCSGGSLFEIRSLRLARTTTQNGQRMALVEASNGGYYRLANGDCIGSGWRVASVADDAVRIVRGEHEIVLRAASAPAPSVKPGG